VSIDLEEVFNHCISVGPYDEHENDHPNSNILLEYLNTPEYAQQSAVLSTSLTHTTPTTPEDQAYLDHLTKYVIFVQRRFRDKRAQRKARFAQTFAAVNPLVLLRGQKQRQSALKIYSWWKYSKARQALHKLKTIVRSLEFSFRLCRFVRQIRSSSCTIQRAARCYNARTQLQNLRIERNKQLQILKKKSQQFSESPISNLLAPDQLQVLHADITSKVNAFVDSQLAIHRYISETVR